LCTTALSTRERQCQPHNSSIAKVSLLPGHGSKKWHRLKLLKQNICIEQRSGSESGHRQSLAFDATEQPFTSYCIDIYLYIMCSCIFIYILSKTFDINISVCLFYLTYQESF
jgi:hypothetical protein